MSKQAKVILWAVLAVLILAGSYFAYTNLSKKYSPETQNGNNLSSGANEEASSGTTTKDVVPAPDFTVYDQDGNGVTLSSFKGKPVVVNFWASWCGYCKQEMPAFQSAYEQYGENVAFLMVNLTTSDTMEKAQQVISQNNFTFPVYFDKDGTAGLSYPTSSLPASAFIDADGNVKAMVAGAMNADRLTKYIGQIYTPTVSRGG